MKMYSIFDRTAQAYQKPFYALNDGMAVRLFSQAVNDKQSDFFNNPEDYILYHIGAFDEGTGELYAQETPVKVMYAQELKEEDEPTKVPAVQELISRVETLLREIRNHQIGETTLVEIKEDFK